MTLNEAIKKWPGNPTLLRRYGRNLLPEFFKEQGFKVGAEIGVYKGLFSEMFCQAGLKMYSIDPWLAYKGAGRSARNQEEQDAVYEEAKNILAQYGRLSVIVRKTSTDALQNFRNESLDFIYIDGNHIFPYAAMDIYEWSKKVRRGGVVSGHDYFNTPPHATNVMCHVKAAVDAYVALQGIDNWWVIGNKNPSWLWFKK